MTTQTDEYNGWTNRETWAAHLWLSNDEGLYNWATEIAEADYDYDHERDDAFQAFVSELFDEFGDNREIAMMRDEVGSLWRVDWRAVADAFREEE